jgi:hypothetical protein
LVFQNKRGAKDKEKFLGGQKYYFEGSKYKENFLRGAKKLF